MSGVPAQTQDQPATEIVKAAGLEPTEPMVEAAARAMYEVWYPHGLPQWGEAVITKERWRAAARAALIAGIAAALEEGR